METLADRCPLWHLLRVALVVLSVSTVACDAPPRAPEDLESLLGYIFEHMDDDDTAELVDGLEQLHIYMQDPENLQSARMGFQIKNLNDSAVDALDTEDRDADGLRGITVVTKSPNCVRDLAALLTWDEFDKVLKNFDFYRREFERDPQCFADRECAKIRADSHTKSAWGGIIEMETRYAIQYRWVDTEYGRMVLHRFWLKERADGDSLDVKMHANYYIGVAMADGARATKPVSASFRQAANGVIGNAGNDIETMKELLNSAGTLRIHANWFSIEQPLGDDFALEQLIQTQITDSQRLDTWLSDHPEQVTCTVEDVVMASAVSTDDVMSMVTDESDAVETPEETP